MPDAPPRILLAGSYGHGNAGDEAILAAILGQLRARLPDARVEVVAGDVEGTRERFGVEAIAWDEWAGIACAARRADLILQGGGGIFFDYTGFDPARLFENGAPDLHHYGSFPLLAGLYGKHYMLYGVGVGPLSTSEGREMTRLAFSLAHLATVRDPESKALLEELGLPGERVEVTADPAFTLLPTGPARVDQILAAHDLDRSRPLLAIAPRPWERGEVPLSVWESALARAAADCAARRRARILLIPFHPAGDNDMLYRLYERIGGQDVRVLRGDHSPAELAGLIGACDLLIGVRLHALVFAILTATPAVALSYDPKVRGLARRAGREDICLGLGELDRLPQALDRAWEGREALAADFRRAAAALAAQAESNANRAIALLAGDPPARTAPAAGLLPALAHALEGRLRAIRVQDYHLARLQRDVESARDEGRRKLGVVLESITALARVAEHEGPAPAQPTPAPPRDTLGQLEDFLRGADPAGRLALVYAGRTLPEGEHGPVLALARALAAAGNPTLYAQLGTQATEPGAGLFGLSLAALQPRWEEALRLRAPGGGPPVLIILAPDPDLFGRVELAHAIGWTTVYLATCDWPSQRSPEVLAWYDPEIERYFAVTAEHAAAPDPAQAGRLRALGAREVWTLPEDPPARTAGELLARLEAATPASPVRAALALAPERSAGVAARPPGAEAAGP